MLAWISIVCFGVNDDPADTISFRRNPKRTNVVQGEFNGSWSLCPSLETSVPLAPHFQSPEVVKISFSSRPRLESICWQTIGKWFPISFVKHLRISAAFRLFNLLIVSFWLSYGHTYCVSISPISREISKRRTSRGKWLQGMGTGRMAWVAVRIYELVKNTALAGAYH